MRGEFAVNSFDGKVYILKDQTSVGIATTTVTVNPWDEPNGVGAGISYSSDVNVLGVVTATSFHGDGSSLVGIDTSNMATITGTETLTNKTFSAPVFQSGSNSPQFLEQRFVNANTIRFSQVYGGGANGSYFTQGEYQKICTIIPDGNSQNYTFIARITATSASSYQIVYFSGALRSNTLPDLSFTTNYYQEHNGTQFIEPKLFTKETSTAGFIIAFEYIHNQNLYGNITCDVDIIPRSSGQRDNITINTTENSEQTSVDTGYTENDATLIYTNRSGTLEFGTQFRFEGSTEDGSETTITAEDPTADRTITFPDSSGTVALVGGNVGDVTGNLTGNVTGNVTGDVTGNLTGDVTGNVTGDLTGNVTGNVTGQLTGNVNSTGISTISGFTFPSTDGTEDQALVTDGNGGLSFKTLSGGGGGAVGGATTIASGISTATQGQTSFTAPNVFDDGSQATPFSVIVSVNGIKQRVGSSNDFQLSAPQTVSFNSGLTAGDLVQIVVYFGHTFEEELFTSTQDQATFTLAGNLSAAKNYRVYLNGVRLRRDIDYQASAAVVLSEATSAGDEVDICSDQAEDQLTANEGQTAFAPSNSDTTSDNMEVYLNGVLLERTVDWTIGSPAVTIINPATGLDLGDQLDVVVRRS